MSEVTLQAIEAKQNELAEMIARFKAAPPARKAPLVLAEVTIDLRAAESYAGALLNEDGTIAHHVILLPGATEEATWDAATEWARKVGGELPTRREQALLYANLKGEFEPEWYWSSEVHEDDGSYFWGQYFLNGHQTSYLHKSYEGRARAVRRFPA